MSRPNTHCRPRRPAPIDSHKAAIDLLGIAVARPLRDETLGVLLDARGQGDTILIVDDTFAPDAVLDVAACLAETARHTSGFAKMMLVTCRPSDGLLPDDVDLWCAASDLAEGADLTLVEWYVVHPGGIDCPRDLLGERPRW
jgi:hypothetical protein